ncbi:MAG: 50S ribosome-binding GTPase, partial [Alphaproteobacteria bacterium]|nr:50S ribosome-binding GTPase [Alphaproteobacteria bacterium]
ELKYALAYIEAYIDFPEEEIPEEELEKVNKKIYNVITLIKEHLKGSGRGKALKEGILFAIVGAPNVGKSSLLNALAQKEVAIVNQKAGTTRDILETYLNIEGYPVILADTAGLRETEEEIEKEGIRRALRKADEADFVLVVEDGELYPKTQSETYIKDIDEHKIIRIWNKKDKMPSSADVFKISAKTGDGLDDLFKILSEKTVDFMGNSEDVMLTRERYKESLDKCHTFLKESLKEEEVELKAESLRLASKELGKITGQIQINELLDVIFSEFCIGK